MPWSFIIPAAASLIGGSMQASAAEDAAASANAQQDKAIQLQREMFQQQREDQAPYRTAGYNALAEMQRTAGNVPGAFKFGAGDYQADPGYAFRLSEGRKALAHKAGARGGLVSGQTLKGMQDYAQESASNEFQNAYNRALTGYNTGVASENQLYNRQAALSGIGQTATNLVGAAGQTYGSNVGNALINQGINTGNARMAGASAYGSALSGIGSAYGRNPVSFSSLYGGGGYSGAGQVNPVSGEYMGSLEF